MEKENLKKITALLVHVAKVDENYSEKEKSIIKNFIVSFSYNDKDSENDNDNGSDKDKDKDKDEDKDKDKDGDEDEDNEYLNDKNKI